MSRAALALAAALALPGCSFAVNHPAVTAGIVGGALGGATCKLASDDLGACVAVAGGAGAFLGLVAAAALWLGGDGHTAPTEETAQPLPDDGHPVRHRRHRAPPTEPAAPAATDPSASPPGAPPPAASPPAPPAPPPVAPPPVPPTPPPAPPPVAPPPVPPTPPAAPAPGA
jgi:hypothetical protein